MRDHPTQETNGSGCTREEQAILDAYDAETALAKLRAAIGSQIPMLADAQHANQAGRTQVVDEYLGRVIDALSQAHTDSKLTRKGS